MYHLARQRVWRRDLHAHRGRLRRALGVAGLRARGCRMWTRGAVLRRVRLDGACRGQRVHATFGAFGLLAGASLVVVGMVPYQDLATKAGDGSHKTLATARVRGAGHASGACLWLMLNLTVTAAAMRCWASVPRSQRRRSASRSTSDSSATGPRPRRSCSDSSGFRSFAQKYVRPRLARCARRSARARPRRGRPGVARPESRLPQRVHPARRGAGTPVAGRKPCHDRKTRVRQADSRTCGRRRRGR